MTHLIIKFRWWIIAACILAGGAFAVLIPMSETDPEIRNYIPEQMPSKIATDRIEKEFGTQDMVVILFTDSCILKPDALNQIKEVDRSLARIAGISDRISPFTMKTIKGEEGAMVAEKLIEEIPSDTEAAEKLRKRICENPLAGGVVISPDFRAAAISATINGKNGEIETLNKIDSVVKAVEGPAKVVSGGLPYIRRYIMRDVKNDAVFIVPAALLIMLLMLKITLGRWKSVFIPFMVVVLSTTISMGMIPMLGWKLSILSLLVPIILVAVANNYGIYLVARHQELSRTWTGSNRDLIKNLLGSLNMPILFSGLTTIAGILGLLTHSIIPAKQGGILAAAGVTIALVMSLLFIPALLFIRGPENVIPEKTVKSRWSAIILGNLSELIVNHSGKILAGAAIFILVISLGIIRLKTDTNQEHLFPEKHPVRKASGIINSSFGGSQTISVMISGDIKDPSVMKSIDNLTEKLSAFNGVGNVFSISKVVREMTKAVYLEDEPGYDKIPGTREGIAQLFELYNMSGDQGDFDQMMSSDNTKAHILVRLSNPENRIINHLKDLISAETKSIDADVLVGGYAVIMADFAGAVIKGQIISLLFAVVTVFFLLAVIFRSFKGGLIGSLPLIVSIIVLFGIMGLAGIALDAATALLSSVMIGVGVDFTIQYMWCYNSELRLGLSHKDATRAALTTIGRSIFINAFSVMAGFSALIFSGFTSIRFFGYLVLISIGACFIGAILIVPAFLLKFRPWFIEKDLSRKKQKEYEKKSQLIPAASAAFPAGTSSAT